MAYPWDPLRRYFARNSGRFLFRRPIVIRTERPIITFTFDDFPRTALLGGGGILNSFGLSGTFYTALGSLGKDSPSGEMFCLDDLKQAIDQGHELGCHTFSHDDSWHTKPSAFESSIMRNRAALSELIPGARFESFSYPLSSPQPMVKRAAARHFRCCRGGGQKFNTGTADLNQLSAYFLEKARGDIQSVKDLIDANRKASGWLIFATHDVSPNPSPYGCAPQFFENVVRYAMESGALVVSIARALDAICVKEKAA